MNGTVNGGLSIFEIILIVCSDLHTQMRATVLDLCQNAILYEPCDDPYSMQKN
jgi:hypothetical protein